MKRKVPITFLPSGVTAWVDAGTTVLEAARHCGVVITAPCGGRGVCGSCGARVVEGELEPPGPEESAGLKRGVKGIRLACRARVSGPVTVRPVVSAMRTLTAEETTASEVVVGIDLGTTNVAAAAIELVGGRELARSLVPNAQQSWGGDVITRLSRGMEGEAPALREAAERSIADAIEAAGVGGRVTRVVVAANTIMAALLTGADIEPLTRHPFSAPQFPEFTPATPELTASLGGAEMLIVPPVLGLVGGDILAGLVHTGMLYSVDPVLLVDLGTNAEIALMSGGRLWVTSAAAGPAFEGAGIESGGPAVAGAVTAVVDQGETGDPSLEVIGGGAPLWFSGAGLISALAWLRRRGLIGADGGFVKPAEPLERLQTGDDGVVRFVFESAGHALTQMDVRSLQLAKAAVRVAVTSLLEAAQMDATGLARVYVGGAFGSAVSPDDLIELGVLPTGMRPAITMMGNVSLNGASELALDPSLISGASSLARDATGVDLAAQPDFSERLIVALELTPYA